MAEQSSTHNLLSGSQPKSWPNIILSELSGWKTSAPNLSNGRAVSSPRVVRVARRFPKNRFMRTKSSVQTGFLDHAPAQALGTGFARLPFPYINQQLAGKGNDGLFATPQMGLALQQHARPLFDQPIVRLLAHHAPCALDEAATQAPVARLGNAQIGALLAAAADAAGQPAVTAQLAAALETLPIPDFPLQDLVGQCSHALGQKLGRCLRNLDSQDVDLPPHTFNDPPESFQWFHQPGGQLCLELDPARRLPPIVAMAVSLAEQQHTALGGKAQPFAPELIALPAQGALLFLLDCRHVHHRKSLPVAGYIAVQSDQQLRRVRFIRVDSLAPAVQARGANHKVDHPQGF